MASTTPLMQKHSGKGNKKSAQGMTPTGNNPEALHSTLQEFKGKRNHGQLGQLHEGHALQRLLKMSNT